MALKRKCSDSETAGAAMCVSDCGFFGSAATNNMCSRCYREHLLSTAGTTATLEKKANCMASVFTSACSSAPPEKKAKTCVAVASSFDAAALEMPSSLSVTTVQQPATAKPPATLEKKANCMASVFTSACSSAPPEKKAKTCVAVASSFDAAALEMPSSLSVTTVQQPATAKPPAAANRCATCRRKVGLTGFRCRCGGTFCGVHRYSDAHGCGFDYKSAGRDQIARQNPLVVAAKIAKI